MSTISVSNVVGSTVTYTPDTTGNLTFTASNGIVDASGLSGSVILPSGTTAQRSANVNGLMRYNTTTANIEAYINGLWVNVP